MGGGIGSLSLSVDLPPRVDLCCTVHENGKVVLLDHVHILHDDNLGKTQKDEQRDIT